MREINYYRATSRGAAPQPALTARVDAAVCVVGGGFAGLNTALGLAERGIRDVVLIDAHEVGHGASGRNGGFVFGGFSRGEDALLRDVGPRDARALYSGTTSAIELIRTRASRYEIDCDLNTAGVIWANWFRDPNVLLERQSLLAERYGVQWQWLSRDDVRRRIHSERYHDALFEPDAFHFHPLKYARGLRRVAMSAGVRVFENSPAASLEPLGAGWRVRTPEGEITAERVVLACGGYLARLRRRVDASVLPIATYVMVTEPLGARLREVLSTDAAIYDTRFAFDYYRPLPDTRLLWGGRISVRDRSPAAVETLLRRDLLKVFPQLDGVRIDYAWSGLMSYARHQMPQVGEIEPGLWVAQAFGGHGVAPTTFAGELIASAIAEGDTRWQALASAYGLTSAMKPAGFIAAQLSYWWAEAKDALKETSEARPGTRHS
ncbi:NAD(P)/FAD-dependent oxidoreductase [Cognatilysobacter bugurensis]|uniref:FAD-binding oxidoreductase n=1 Tax=Cognatilysobacter bugurensis TaxID=543356 RepID=A0A918SXK2_9GAMM|nr:FAD-binding oxidoreductase [Lysobacter bugurensis]GHA74224.1 FAD-binding oxidoreductase [Lysobacter bugurensis]